MTRCAAGPWPRMLPHHVEFPLQCNTALPCVAPTQLHTIVCTQALLEDDEEQPLSTHVANAVV